MESFLLQQPEILLEVLRFSLRAFLWIIPGILVVNMLIEIGLLQKLVAPVGWFFRRFANLPPEIASAFLASFGSSYAGGSMLVNFKNRGLLNDRQVLLSSITFSIPFHIRELFSYYIPISFSILGLTLGGMYIAVHTITIIVKFFFVIAAGRLTLPAKDNNESYRQAEAEKPFPKDWVSVFRKSTRECFRTVKRMAVSIPLAALIIYELSALGVFQLLPVQAESLGLPSCSTACLITYMANSLMGLTAIAACFQGAELTLIEAIKTMLWASILAAPVFLIRFSGTYYFGVYGPKLGLKIGLISSGLNIFVYAVCLAAVSLF
ncbi:hypothetical protein LPY66_06685 [Dehalobacter sp. DCM]|uniref:nucleoside recognition domain-containing protein n=1 Tax=Dehalobacter sp. DCM TaxID=2907827 RepID=UPI003081B404|nr:hypothetical protein LPY66_06685 [Dehalobacter sp. DCM]